VAIANSVKAPRPQTSWSSVATFKIRNANRTSDKTNEVTFSRCPKTCLQRFVLAAPGPA
jgi:hypothetical protein